jgi:hypothetical protein
LHLQQRGQAGLQSVPAFAVSVRRKAVIHQGQWCIMQDNSLNSGILHPVAALKAIGTMAFNALGSALIDWGTQRELYRSTTDYMCASTMRQIIFSLVNTCFVPLAAIIVYQSALDKYDVGLLWCASSLCAECIAVTEPHDSRQR